VDCTFLGAFHVPFITAKPALYSGDGMAKGGIILGWIGVALLVLVVAGLVLFLSSTHLHHGSAGNSGASHKTYWAQKAALETFIHASNAAVF
jgi:hypothetical protein